MEIDGASICGKKARFETAVSSDRRQLKTTDQSVC
jgi:hypothetical protein